MKKNILVVILMLLTTNAYANEWTGNLNFFLGKKMLDESDWAPLDNQPEFGVLVDFKLKQWPFSFAIDYLVSTDDAPGLPSVEAITSEVDIGLRKIWNPGNSSIRPYIGGGLAYASAELKTLSTPSITVDDGGYGIWLNGGVYWTLGQSFNLGLDLRYSQADVTLFGVEGEAGGTHAGIILGYHW